MAPPAVSVVIRARDQAHSIGDVLDALRCQTLESEVVVVDSGSRDGTPDIVRQRGVGVIALAPSEFSFGRALNTGTSHTHAAIVVALSADALPRREDWLARVVAHFADERVACASGEVRDIHGRPLSATVLQDAHMLRANPYWGYSNAAGGFRAELWRARPFREDLPGTEDREWSRWALEQGYVCALDPALTVEHDHSRDSLRACFARYEREHRGFAIFLDLGRYGLRELAVEWWTDQGWHRSRGRARVDPRRMARLAGKWWGRRRARADLARSGSG